MFNVLLFLNIIVCSSFFEDLIKQHNDIIAFHMEIEDVLNFVESNNLLKSNEKIRFITIKQNLTTFINGLEITRVYVEDEHVIFGLFEDISNLLLMLKLFKSTFNEIRNFRKYFTPLITDEHIIIVNKVDSFERQFIDLKIKFVRYFGSKNGNHYNSFRFNTASPREFDRISIN